MITCYLRYTIDPYKLEAFERYSRMILPLAAKPFAEPAGVMQRAAPARADGWRVMADPPRRRCQGGRP